MATRTRSAASSASSIGSIRLSRAWEMAHPLWIGLGLAHLLNAFLQRRLTRAALFAASLIGAWLFRMARFS